MSRTYVIIAVLVAVLGGALFLVTKKEDERRALYFETIEYGSKMEENRRFSEAVLTYQSALELDLADSERAEVRFRLARALIEGNDLNGALGVLRDMASEDVLRFEIDIGPLYMKLGTRAKQNGQEALARIAYREGGGVSPDRYEDFARRLEDLSNAAPNGN